MTQTADMVVNSGVETKGIAMATDGFYWDGYLHWARDIELKDPELSSFLVGGGGTNSPRLYEPIFIRLESLKLEELEPLAVALRDLYFPCDDANPEFRDKVARTEALSFLSDFAYDCLELVIGFEHAVKENRFPEFFVYRPVAETWTDHTKYESLFTVIDVGAPALVDREPDRFNPTEVAGFREAKTFAAVIDNDLGYLNRNFRNRDGETRFVALWLQARERMTTDPITNVAQMHVGLALNATAINEMIRTYGRDERRAYGDMNAKLHTRAAFKLPPPIAAHGTMVTDLAFGNQSVPSMVDVPLSVSNCRPKRRVTRAVRRVKATSSKVCDGSASGRAISTKRSPWSSTSATVSWQVRKMAASSSRLRSRGRSNWPRSTASE